MKKANLKKDKEIYRKVVPRKVVPRKAVPRKVVPRKAVPRKVVPRKAVPIQKQVELMDMMKNQYHQKVLELTKEITTLEKDKAEASHNPGAPSQA